VVETYPAITLWQPWASLIAGGAKPYEFRSWPAPQRLVGRRVAVHAGVRRMPICEVRELRCRCERGDRSTGLRNELALQMLDLMMQEPECVPYGSVLCLATLGRPIRDADLAAKLGLPSVNDSDRDEHSNWGWPLTDIEILRPFVPARGAQGWWRWTR
jgi:hypothetical protein